MFRDLIEEMDDDAPEPKEFLDVPFVPTDDVVIKAMLRLAKVGRKDMLYDLGAGEQPIHTAAHVHGLYSEPDLVNANHRNHSRNSAAHWAAALIGQDTRTVAVSRFTSRQMTS